MSWGPKPADIHASLLLRTLNDLYQEERFCDVILSSYDDSHERSLAPSLTARSLDEATTLESSFAGEIIEEESENTVPEVASREIRRYVTPLAVSSSDEDQTNISYKDIPCHKLVLCASSDYFAAMFSCNMREASEPKVVLRDTRHSSLKTIIDFAYTGEIDFEEHDVYQITLDAHMLQFGSLVDRCTAHFEKSLTISSCIDVLLYAQNNHLTKLCDSTLHFVMEHFPEVLEKCADDFYQSIPLEILRKMLQSDDLNVSVEEQAFKCFMTWVETDVETRKESVGELFQLIRVPFLPVEFLLDTVSANPFISAADACQSVIMEGMKWHLRPEKRMSSPDMPRTIPRISTMGVLIAIGGIDTTIKMNNTIERYNISRSHWRCCTIMASKRVLFGAASIDGIAYIVGGREGLKTLNSMLIYDMSDDLWKNAPTMDTARHSLAVCVVAGTSLYAIGGHDGWSYLTSVERFDTTTDLTDRDSWSPVPAMKAARANCGAAAVNDKIYVVGGRDGSSALRSVEMYDPHSNKWQYRASMNQRRAGVGVTVFNDMIFAVGGYDSPEAMSRDRLIFDSCEKYDCKENVWTYIACLGVGRDSACLGVLGNRIYCLGGHDGHKPLSMTEEYDPYQDTWTQSAQMTHARVNACCVTLKY